MNETMLPTTARFGTSDHRAELAAAMRVAEAVVSRLPADSLHRPTPCTGLDVAQLVGHLVFVGQRLEAMYTGQNDADLEPWAPLEIAPADAAARLAAQNARVEAVLADASVLDRTIMPWRPMSVRESLPCYVSEYTVHTWDVATAAGLAVSWDDAVVALSQEAMECEIPAEQRAAIFAQVLEHAPEGVVAPFGDALPAPAGATAIERLAAYVGRTVPAAG